MAEGNFKPEKPLEVGRCRNQVELRWRRGSRIPPDARYFSPRAARAIAAEILKAADEAERGG